MFTYALNRTLTIEYIPALFYVLARETHSINLHKHTHTHSLLGGSERGRGSEGGGKEGGGGGKGEGERESGRGGRRKGGQGEREEGRREGVFICLNPLDARGALILLCTSIGSTH